MKILGIETSCDETGAAVLEGDPTTRSTRSGQGGRIKILSNVLSSSAKLQAKYGGIIPEQAAREQIKAIIPVIESAIHDSLLTINDIDAVAVTEGPGLIGSLLVGVETAKTLSLIWNKPLIPVNHLIGHFYANWIQVRKSDVGNRRSDSNYERSAINNIPKFPCLGLLVSGGHTDLVLFKDHGKYEYLGGTRDDAAGECFDKCARLLGLPYPGGPQISKLAQSGNPKAFDLPRPMIDSDDLDFSFSGLKTSVSNIVNGISGKNNDKRLTTTDKQNLAASIEQAIIDVLIVKTIKAALTLRVEQIMVAGGVASNQKLVSQLQLSINNEQLSIKLFVPPPYLCTDNAAMIASAALFQQPFKNPLDLRANPNLSLAY